MKVFLSAPMPGKDVAEVGGSSKLRAGTSDAFKTGENPGDPEVRYLLRSVTALMGKREILRPVFAATRDRFDMVYVQSRPMYHKIDGLLANEAASFLHFP